MIEILSGNEYKRLLPSRKENSNKTTFGTVGLVCGSTSYQGAATFATSAALHTGVGIAVAFIPDTIYVPFASKISGAVIEPLHAQDGMISDLSLPSKISKRKCTALLCGSGIGLSDASARTVCNVAQMDIPIVFDGDALKILAKDKSLFDRKNVTVITPHIGEFAVMYETTPDDVRKNRILYAQDFAKRYNCIVVLKDYVTVICDAMQNVKVYSAPTSALSKGGSGDVLAGMLASFIAQGVQPITAACCAVTLHNACGRLSADKYGCYYAQPENIIDSILKLLR